MSSQAAAAYDRFETLQSALPARFRLSRDDTWFFDQAGTHEFDRHYVYHTAWAARIVARLKPARLDDFSSFIHFANHVSAFLPVRFHDYRSMALGLPGLEHAEADLTRLPYPDGALELASCLHVVEHIGLGRYGDPLDPDGDLKALGELKRVVRPGGSILLALPVGRVARIVFNAHRIYTWGQVLAHFPGWKLRDSALITDRGGDPPFIPEATSEQADRQGYGCGCFWLQKPATPAPRPPLPAERLLVVLKSTHKHAARIAACRESWLRDAPRHLCLTDRPLGIGAEFSGSDRDDYLSAEQKTVSMINALRERPEYRDYDWFFFIDDDAVLNVSRFLHLAPWLDPQVIYGKSMRGYYPREPGLDFPSGGGGYAVSRALLARCAPMRDRGLGLEDVSLGYWARDNAIVIAESASVLGRERLLGFDPWFPFRDTEARLRARGTPEDILEARTLTLESPSRPAIARTLTQHYIKTARAMRFIWSCHRTWRPALDQESEY